MKSSESTSVDTLTKTTSLRISQDVVIIGGGIAGLWLLNSLRNSGYSVLLLDQNALGSGQTLAAQGIIHGGLKYALSGKLSTASNAIVEMPARWRRALEGEGSVDLRGCELLSDAYYMWSASSFRSRVKTYLGSKSLRGRVKPVNETELPPFFGGIRERGQLYKLPDFVINTPSLLAKLASNYHESIRSSAGFRYTFPEPQGDSEEKLVRLTGASEVIDIHCQKVLLCAGSGNEDLIAQAGISGVEMQTRPLKMVYLKDTSLTPLFCHCIGGDFRMNPAMTITSHRDKNGCITWYLGGDLAELGVQRSDDEQIAAAAKLLQNYFPQLDLGGALWSCLDIGRAENKADGNHRPDNPFLAHDNGFVTVWPTKLTLAPALGDEMQRLFAELAIHPQRQQGCDHSALEVLKPLPIAAQHWDRK